jgi:hypothetical protein
LRAGLKSRACARQHVLPSWFTASNEFAPGPAGLALFLVRANSVGAAITQRTTTMGGALQIRGRTNFGPLERAVHAQHVAVQLTLALARALALRDGVRVVDQLGTTALQPALLPDVGAAEAQQEAGVDTSLEAAVQDAETFVLPFTTLCSNNARAHKTGVGSVVSAARLLAQAERREQLLSSAMLCTGRDALQTLCAAILQDAEWDARAANADPVWASIVLVVFLTSHPRLRALLAAPELQLTAVDLAAASAIEFYGRTELVRRTRLEQKRERPAARARNEKRFKPSNVRRDRHEAKHAELLRQVREQHAQAADDDESPAVAESRRQMLAMLDRSIARAEAGETEAAAPAAASEDDEYDEEVGPPTIASAGAGSSTAVRSASCASDAEASDEEADAVREFERAMLWDEGDEGEEGEEGEEGAGDAETAAAEFLVNVDSDVMRANCADARLQLEFWNAAALHQKDEEQERREQERRFAVLKTLVSVCKRSAAEAASAVLTEQAQHEEQLATNEVLLRVAQDTALRSAELLATLLGRKASDSLAVVAGKPTCGMPAVAKMPAPGALCVALQETPSPAVDAALFAFRRAPPQLAPAAGRSGFALCHAVATQELMPQDQEHAVFPGVLERMQAAARIETRAQRSATAQRDASRLKECLRTHSAPPAWADSPGLTRTLIVSDVIVRVHARSARSASALARECTAAARAGLQPGETVRRAEGGAPARLEPRMVPAPRAAVGLRAAAHIVEMPTTKSRRGRVSKAYVGPTLPGDYKPQAKEQPIVADNDPPPILAIMDWQLSFVAHAATAAAAAERLQAGGAERGMELLARQQLLVCADNAVRVPEALALLRRRVLTDPASLDAHTAQAYFTPVLPDARARRSIGSIDARSAVEAVRQTLALLAVATSQASYIECCSCSMGAGMLNSQINQSKRPPVADNTTFLAVTAFDAFCGGIRNLRQRFQGSGERCPRAQRIRSRHSAARRSQATRAPTDPASTWASAPSGCWRRT